MCKYVPERQKKACVPIPSARHEQAARPSRRRVGGIRPCTQNTPQTSTKRIVKRISRSSNKTGTYMKERRVLDVLRGAGRALERGGQELSVTL